MKKNNNFLSIIAPVKDEQENIEWTINNLKKFVKIKYELVIVYDSEKDKTLPILKKLKKDNKFIKLKKNMLGKGVLNAIKTGFKYSSGDVLVMMAVDRTDDPRTLNLMYKKIKDGYDVVCPTRYSLGGKVVGKISIKSLLSRMSGISTPLILGIPTSDLTYSYKMFRREVINKIDIKSKGGFEFAEELLIKAHFLDFKIIEVPTKWIDRRFGKSKFLLRAWLPRYIYWYMWGIRKRIQKILNRQRIGFTLISLYFSELLFIFVFFRLIRDGFPEPEIGVAGIIGYSQYFGYPIYLDSILFYAFILMPLIFCYILFERRKNEIK